MARTITKQCPRVLLPNNTYRIHAREFTLAEPVEGTLVMPTYLSITRVLFIKTWYRVRRRVSHARSLTTCIPGVAFRMSTNRLKRAPNQINFADGMDTEKQHYVSLFHPIKLTEKWKDRGDWILEKRWFASIKKWMKEELRDDFRDFFSF